MLLIEVTHLPTYNATNVGIAAHIFYIISHLDGILSGTTCQKLMNACMFRR